MSAVAPGPLDVSVSKRAFFLASLSYHARLKRLALVIAATTTPLLLWMASAFNHLLSSLPGCSPSSPSSEDRWCYSRDLHSASDVLSDASDFGVRHIAIMMGLVVGLVAGLGAFIWLLELNRSAQLPMGRSELSWTALGIFLFVVIYGGAPFTPYFTEITSLTIPVAIAIMVIITKRQGRLMGMPALWRYVTLTVMLGGVLVLLYTRFLPAVFFSSGDGTRLFLRLVVHPVLLELVFAPLRHFGKAFPCSSLAPIRLLGGAIILVANLFGRLMAANMESAGATAIVLLGISALEVLQRTTILLRDEFYYRLFMSKREARAYALSAKGAEVKANVILVDNLSEDVGILLSGVCALVFRIRLSQGSKVLSLSAVLLGTGIQWVLELATDLVPAAFAWGMAPQTASSSLPALRQGGGGGAGKIAALPVDTAVRAVTLVSAANELEYGRVARQALRVKQNVINTHNAEQGMDRVHILLLIVVFSGWACVFLRGMFFPFTGFCATGPVESLGLTWWSWSPCPS